ncbi:hypothetical protein CHGG_06238 [Chaetomium globosum CBS 148.51]|uniref:Zn(2)-C6 fungal-type domain-containing protein n=1 Tax=Chaetomium globosum (strain ATCC 6205 / CBS 148.51 / DSM 1962 / NBRC 6347 / NRRL 1970) TaxID=306901 RepID=Q2H527_CHAGB|nr:uncharacterized protein CHGG_06238 [Chaetomium globosum CBS 148.51]EAQ89619.1 hypothetical protein CHGG_06238 [Chaetomium globosum CBS 148.51]
MDTIEARPQPASAPRAPRITNACEACRAAKVKCQASTQLGICKRPNPPTTSTTSTTSPLAPPRPPPPGPSKTFTIDIPMSPEDDIADSMEALRLTHEMGIDALVPNVSEGDDDADYYDYDEHPDHEMGDYDWLDQASVSGVGSVLSGASSLPVGASALSTPPSSAYQQQGQQQQGQGLSGGQSQSQGEGAKGKSRTLASLRLQPQFNLDSAGKLLETFRGEMMSHFHCVVLREEETVAGMAKDRPFVLLAILAAASGSSTLQGHSLYDEEFRKILGLKFVAGGERTIELLQGLVIYIAWWVCPPTRGLQSITRADKRRLHLRPLLLPSATREYNSPLQRPPRATQPAPRRPHADLTKRASSGSSKRPTTCDARSAGAPRATGAGAGWVGGVRADPCVGGWGGPALHESAVRVVLGLAPREFNAFIGVEWGALILSIILGFRMSFPLLVCPEWDDGAARGVVRFEEYITRFCRLGEGAGGEVRAIPPPAVPGVGVVPGAAAGQAKSMDVLSASRIVLDMVKRKFMRRLVKLEGTRKRQQEEEEKQGQEALLAAAAAAAAAAAPHPISVPTTSGSTSGRVGRGAPVHDSATSGCPMMDGSLEPYYPYWDETFNNGLAATSSAFVAEAQGGGQGTGAAAPPEPGSVELPDDLWTAMTMGWAQGDINFDAV